MIKKIIKKIFVLALRLIGPFLRYSISQNIKYIDKSYEFRERVEDIFLHTSTDQPIYIDVGARRGVDTRHWEYKNFFDFHLFEPDPHEASFLSEYYGNVHNCALSDRTGETELYVTDDPGSSYTKSNVYADDLNTHKLSVDLEVIKSSSKDISNVIKVPVYRLADFEFNKPIIYMKIDVQGEEVQILNGLGNEYRPAVLKIEASSITQDQNHSSITQTLIWAEKNNYSLLGVAFEDNGINDWSSEFDIALQGDILLIDENYKSNPDLARMIGAMLLVFGMYSPAEAILKYSDLKGSEKGNLPKFSKKIFKFVYNNAHDRRGL